MCLTWLSEYPGSQVNVMWSLKIYLDCRGSRCPLRGATGGEHSEPEDNNIFNIHKKMIIIYEINFSNNMQHQSASDLWRCKWVSSRDSLQSCHCETGCWPCYFLSGSSLVTAHHKMGQTPCLLHESVDKASLTSWFFSFKPNLSKFIIIFNYYN